MSTDWFQDDLLGVSNSGFSGGPEQLETLAEVKVGVQDNQLQTTSSKASDNKTTDKDDDSFDAWNDFASSSSAPNLVDGSVKQNGVDWVQDNQLQTTSSKAPDNKTTNEDDDSFDAWNDFASSSNAPKVVDSSVKQSGVDWVQDNQLQTTVNKPADNKTTDADDDSFDAWNDFTGSNNASNLADSSVQQSNNQTTPVDHTSEINLFGAASNSGDLDFGSFLQPDFSAGAFNSSSGSTVVDGAQPEPSILDRLADASTNNGKKSEDVAEGGDVSSARAGSKSDDVERIMSQMHDLSFMLESTLSMPPKQDELHPPSKD
ncbi:dentin sialophosphoprotein-like [Pyrus ussuriensis x Pyrus communis]|uniref:Dentin sialophosphoprotein-like n=1 Tax=Pyrus ussuriensis x Pyrus communis TaxID=2448454 RepID=A0A5N5GJZ2_9ROSA|nr:dentin sialophosphoprotein-like [Pyrus ussuriensis x Pyrus communis]